MTKIIMSFGAVTVAALADLRQFTGPDLLKLHNAATGKTTSKFASRSKGENQTIRALKGIEEIDLTSLPPLVRLVGATAQAPDPSPATPATARGRGRPADEAKTPTWKAQKQKDGTYRFNMPARKQKAAPGGRRPELIAQLRKAPTWKQLLKRFQVSGETEDQQAFNLATHITCMCHVTGYGVVTQADNTILVFDPIA